MIHRKLPSFSLDLALQVGEEVLVLFGPSGAGKSMTLQSIAGLVTPDRGEIVLDGQAAVPTGRSRARMSTCPRADAGSATCSRTTPCSRI